MPVETVNDHIDDPAAGCQQSGPTLPRMVLGARLRRLREGRGITLEAAGNAIRASHSKVSRLELGRTGFKRRDVADLLTLYGVSDVNEQATLLALATQANAPTWWQPYSDVVPSWFEAYLGLEQAASVIRCYEVQFVPGLLQTEDYARAVIRLDYGETDDRHIERRVELRMKRQRLLYRPVPPHLWAVLDEAALRRPIGGPETMRGQLVHLLEMSRLRHVRIQVLPFSAGGHAAGGGPISILRFAADELPDMVYLEQLISAIYPDKPADIGHYREVMDRLAAEAQPPTETAEILREILREM